MSVQFEIQETLTGGGLDFPGTVASLRALPSPDGAAVQAIDYRLGTVRVLQPGGGVLQPVEQSALGGLPRLPFTSPAGRQLGLSELDLAYFSASGAGPGGHVTGVNVYFSDSSLWRDAGVVLETTDANGDRIVLLSVATETGISAFRVGAGLEPLASGGAPDKAQTYGAGIVGLALVETAQGRFLYAASSLEHGLSGYAVAAGGQLTEMVSLGRSESLAVAAPTALAAAEVAGQPYLVLASAGSSSLTVLSVAEDGGLGVADHVLDGRETRFADISALDVAVINGQTFVTVSGADDGLSLFALTATGRLVHLGSLADSADAVLEKVSALSVLPSPDGLDILTRSSAEAGLGYVSVEYVPGSVQMATTDVLTGGAGNDWLALHGRGGRLDGAGGADILMDGAGQDRLTGGPGADIFVLIQDGQVDVITDFQPGFDRLDLASWPMLRNVGQLSFAATPDGGVLWFADEELRIATADGAPLQETDLPGIVPEFITHLAVVPGPLEVAEPAPPPDPTPTPVPEPSPEPLPEPSPDPLPAPPPAPVQGIRLVGTAGDDTLTGTDGDDGLKGGDGDDVLRGHGGNDRLPGEAGNDRVFGGPGHDRLGGGDGHDLLDGGSGDDRGGGGDGNDTISGGDGNDWFSGGAGQDLVAGNGGHDRLAGSYGNDTVRGGDGNDTMGGGLGTDLLEGGAGDDRIGAGEFGDLVYGQGGNDFLGGGPGNDVLRGGFDDDTLNGGHGDDTLYGGVGSDVFVFNNISASGRDLIRDFEDGSDHLRLVGRRLPEADPFGALDLSGGLHGGVDAVTIMYGNHEIIVLNTTVGDFSAADFLFT